MTHKRADMFHWF